MQIMKLLAMERISENDDNVSSDISFITGDDKDKMSKQIMQQ